MSCSMGLFKKKTIIYKLVWKNKLLLKEEQE